MGIDPVGCCPAGSVVSDCVSGIAEYNNPFPQVGIVLQVLFPAPLPGAANQVRVLYSIQLPGRGLGEACLKYGHVLYDVTNAGFKVSIVDDFGGLVPAGVIRVHWEACPNVTRGVATLIGTCAV